MASEPSIEAMAVSKSFGTFTAVQDMSLTVAPGEIVGLLGANGAGKTTLIRAILGLESISAGEIRVFGAPPSRRARTRLGYMPQGLGLYTQLSVEENVAFVAAAFGVRDAPPLPSRLRELRRERVGAIGLGLQRQLAFHCALLHRPELLVLDEPTSGVDPLARARLWDTIHEQRDAGVAVLVTTHYMQEAEQCSRLAIMSRGRLVAAGTGPEITGGRTAIAVRAAAWSAAFAALGAAGLPVTLAGRDVRVAGVLEAEVRAVLDAAGVAAEVRAIPATLEETMVLIEGGRLVA